MEEVHAKSQDPKSWITFYYKGTYSELQQARRFDSKSVGLSDSPREEYVTSWGSASADYMHEVT